MAYRVDSEAGVYRGGPGGSIGSALARAVDAVLQPFAPRLVLARMQARAVAAQMLNYDAARSHPTRRNLRSGSADRDLLVDLSKLRTNSRAMVRDDSAGSAMVRVLEDNVVGTGLKPQMLVDAESTGLTDEDADAWNRGVEALWRNWSERWADASEHDTFESMQRQVLRSLVVDGEALLHRVYVNPAEQPGRVIGTAFETIDPDRLQDPTGTRNDIRSGVEVGPRQNAVAYWITPRHPDEWNQWTDQARRANQPQRWSRYAGGSLSILHVFRRDRPGQTRGVPFFAPCFGLVESMNDMLQTELNAARAASKFCMFIRQSVDAADPHLSQEDGKQWHERLDNLQIRYLNPGEEPVSFSPNRPGTTFEPFVVRVLRSICAALGLPYEMVLKDFGGMNYSSARVALLEARRGFEALQQLLIDKLCQPVLRSVVMDAVVTGALPMPRGFLANPDLFLRCYWQPPAWGWVDPVKEIDAARLAIENNLSTPQAEAARQGGDAEINLESRARFLRRARDVEERYGLEPGELTRERSERIEAVAPPPTQEPGAPAEEPAPQEQPNP